jgi:hypothetical protein
LINGTLFRQKVTGKATRILEGALIKCRKKLCKVMTAAVDTQSEGDEQNRTAGEEVHTGDIQILHQTAQKYKSLSRLTNWQRKLTGPYVS